MKLFKVLFFFFYFCLFLFTLIYFIFFKNSFISFSPFNNYLNIVFYLIISLDLKNTNVFDSIVKQIFRKSKSFKNFVLIIFKITYLLSAFITNDITLFIILPFLIKSFEINSTDIKTNSVLIALTAVVANLGAFLSPIGNPPNIYMFYKSNLSVLYFIKNNVFLSLFGFFVVVLFLEFFLNKKGVVLKDNLNSNFELNFKFLYYCFLFLLYFVITKYFGFNNLFTNIVFILAVLVIDYKVLFGLDYIFVLTLFFMIIGLNNLKELSFGLKDVFKDEITKFLSVIIFSQIFSNFPACIIFSNLFQNLKLYIWSVNIAAHGFIFASLANNIAFFYYKQTKIKYFLTTQISVLLTLACVAIFIHQASIV